MVRLTDRPDMTLDVYRGRKTTMQQQQRIIWIDDLRFYAPFNSTFIISGRWEGDKERLSAVESDSRLARFPSPAGLEPGPLNQQASA